MFAIPGNFALLNFNCVVFVSKMGPPTTSSCSRHLYGNLYHLVRYICREKSYTQNNELCLSAAAAKLVECVTVIRLRVVRNSALQQHHHSINSIKMLLICTAPYVEAESDRC